MCSWRQLRRYTGQIPKLVKWWLSLNQLHTKTCTYLFSHLSVYLFDRDSAKPLSCTRVSYKLINICSSLGSRFKNTGTPVHADLNVYVCSVTCRWKCMHVRLPSCALLVFCVHSHAFILLFHQTRGVEVNMTFGTRATAGEYQWAHSGQYPLLHPWTSYIPQKHLVPPPPPFSLSPIAPAQVLAVGQGGLRVRGSQLCKCFQLLCDWNWVPLFDQTPRQARPRLFLAAAGDERMSAWL